MGFVLWWNLLIEKQADGVVRCQMIIFMQVLSNLIER
jgi:hypothetical protein